MSRINDGNIAYLTKNEKHGLQEVFMLHQPKKIGIKNLHISIRIHYAFPIIPLE